MAVRGARGALWTHSGSCTDSPPPPPRDAPLVSARCALALGTLCLGWGCPLRAEAALLPTAHASEAWVQDWSPALPSEGALGRCALPLRSPPGPGLLLKRDGVKASAGQRGNSWGGSHWLWLYPVPSKHTTWLSF